MVGGLVINGANKQLPFGPSSQQKENVCNRPEQSFSLSLFINYNYSDQ